MKVIEIERMMKMNNKPSRTIEKTDGNGDTFTIPNPDYYNENGKFRKVRFKHTNITPKKKKRK